jgi:bisanhydrobacterioruberin hydratase
MAKKNKNSRVAIGILIILHIVGAVGFVIPSLTPLFKQLVPYHLLITLVILLAFHQPWKGKFILCALLIMLAGWFIEWVGVQTGKIFGQYHYGATLGYKVDGIPLMIGVNWLILLYCSFFLAEKITKIQWLKYILTAVFMVLMDVLIEPVAVRYDYWQWHTLHIPLQNYIAWGIVSFVMAIGLGSLKIKLQNSVAMALYIIQMCFFIVSNLLL